MHYTLHQLKVFTKVAEHQSITKAAEELHLTQPAVSIQLKKLQEQFDIPLTEVIGRQLYVTDFGKRIMNLSQKLLEEAALINDTTNQYKGLLTGKVKISSVSTGKYVIPYFLTDFIKEHPNIDLNIDVTNKLLVVESLAKNETDFALVSVLPDLSLETHTLMENKLYLVCGSAYFDQINKIKISNLGNYPLIFREQGSATRAAMEGFLKTNGITAKRTMKLVSNEAVKQAVAAGLGLSIMPLIGLRNELQLDLMRVIPIKKLPIISHWNLVYTKGKNLSPVSQALVEHIEAHKSQVIKRHFKKDVI